MKSMTGYGTFKAETKDVSIEVSLRAVNGRFLEARMHLPREYSSLEAELKKTLSQELSRGTVDVFVSRKLKNLALKSKLQVNEPLALEYHKALKSLSKKLKITFTPHVETIARMPDVIRSDDVSELAPGEEKLLKKVFQTALSNCVAERRREGEGLRTLLLKMLKDLEAQIEVVSSLRDEANRQLEERFKTKIQTRSKGFELDPSRVAQEIVIQLEKADINEELMRLAEHFKNYRKILQSEDSEGKKLDFYTQELLREINTIGSKSQISQITQAVVESKTIVERLREQVQNIE